MDTQTIDSLVYHYSRLGEEYVPETGATLIGRAPAVAPLAWLNSKYDPLSHDQIADLESQLRTTIPPAYKSFLTEYSNGLTILVATLGFYGFRKNYIRSLTMVRQPFSLAEGNCVTK